VRKDANITARVVTDADLRRLFDECDADGGATISGTEFVALLGGKPVWAARDRERAERLERAERAAATRQQAARHGAQLAQLRRRFQAASYRAGGQDWDALFRQYDRDNSGELEWEEFRRTVRKDARITKKAVSDAELRGLFDECDVDGGATISRAEFTALLGGTSAPGGKDVESPVFSHSGDQLDAAGADDIR
jgi:Ca2+-binding EF-hand superfamily protein